MLLTFDDRDGKQQNEFDLPPCDFVASDQIWKTDVVVASTVEAISPVVDQFQKGGTEIRMRKGPPATR